MNERYQAVVIGVSAGGISALDKIIPAFGEQFRLPILIVQHISSGSDNYLVDHFAKRCSLTVKEAEDKERILPGSIYFAPPGYHLLVERNRTLALSMEAKVSYSRPSIDVLFETAAEAYLDQLIGVILTGANSDGAAGLAQIKNSGGLTIVQSPETAEADVMPKAAIAEVEVDHILPLDEIASFVVSVVLQEKDEES